MIWAALLLLQDPIALEGSIGDAAFVVKGTTDLPDGASLRVEVFYHHAAPERRVARNRTTVADGKFACECPVRDLTILDGRYVLAVRPDETQPSDFPRAFQTELHRYATSIAIVKGTEEDGRRAVNALRNRLAGEIRAVADAARNARTDVKALRRTVAEIQQRVGSTREYGVAGLRLPVEGVFDDLAFLGEGVARAPAEKAELLKADIDRTAHTVLTALGVTEGADRDPRGPLQRLKGLLAKPDADAREIAACLLDASWADPKLASPLQAVQAALDSGDRAKALAEIQKLLGE